LRVIFAGTPEAALPSLTALIASEHEVVAVLTRPDAQSGRGRIAAPSTVAIAANESGLPIIKASNLRDLQTQEQIASLQPDAVAVVAFGALVPKELLAVPKFGWINLHFSILPSWRGAAPVPQAIRFGDEITGATTFQIDEGLDTGPVFGVVTEMIKENDTAGTLLSRLAKSGANLLVETLSGLGRLRPQPQGTDGVSYAPKVTADDTRIRWAQPSLIIGRQIRAYTPEPGAWTTFRDERLQVGPVEALATRIEGASGEVVASKHEVIVSTGSTAVRLGNVRPAGKREMSAAEWARGVRVTAGEQLV